VYRYAADPHSISFEHLRVGTGGLTVELAAMTAVTKAMVRWDEQHGTEKTTPLSKKKKEGASAEEREAVKTAKSTCAGCQAAMDPAAEDGSAKECPNCRAGEAAGGARHFFCSKACFAKHWKAHKLLHVRRQRTAPIPGHAAVATAALGVFFPPSTETADELAKFGYMTDEEWAAFENSPAFDRSMKAQSTRAKKWGMMQESVRGSETELLSNRGAQAGLRVNLDVICSLETKVTKDEVVQATMGIYYARDAARAGKADATPFTMFEMIRRNFLYFSFHLAHRAETRVVGPNAAADCVQIEEMHCCLPTMLFVDFVDKSKEDPSKRFMNSIVPMWFCANVAEALYQEWFAGME
jgi:hypothetical protein